MTLRASVDREITDPHNAGDVVDANQIVAVKSPDLRAHPEPATGIVRFGYRVSEENFLFLDGTFR